MTAGGMLAVPAGEQGYGPGLMDTAPACVQLDLRTQHPGQPMAPTPTPRWALAGGSHFSVP